MGDLMPMLSSDVDYVRELLTQWNRSRYEFEQMRAHDESVWSSPGTGANTVIFDSLGGRPLLRTIDPRQCVTF